MPDSLPRIAENLARVQARMVDAARRSGRTPDAIQLVAVTKYVGPAEIRALLDAGCRDLGESRPQDLWQKTADLAHVGVRWHLIGHLQRNKVRRTLPLVALLHSVDSLRLLAEIDASAAALGKPVPALLEINVSRDAEKHGLAPEELEHVLGEVAARPHVHVRGLMCMGSREGGLDTARRNFADLRQLRDRLRPVCPSGVSLEELSMGMSDDFEVAIEEGATIVRVGSALFE